MSDFATLAYLDFRQLLNRVRTILHQPGRLIVYVIAIAYFGFLAWVRRINPHGVSGTTIPVMVPEPYASAILFAFVTLLGVIMYGAASGFLGVFSSTADARFLCGSKLSERAVVTWLQIRRCTSAVIRWILLLIFYSLLYRRSGGFAALAPSLIAGALLTVATAIPILKLRVVRGRPTAQLLSAAVVAAGLLPLSILLGSVIGPALGPWARNIESIGAGFAVNALFGRNVWGVSAMYAAAFGLLAFSYVVGNDLYPDLYASSIKVLAFRRQRGRLPGVIVGEREYRESNVTAIWFLNRARGAWTIAWKEWIAFVRAPGAQRMFWFGFFASAAVGAVLGSAARHSAHPLETAGVMSSSIANVIVIFITIASSFGLAEDLRKPLWWMGTDTVWSRLFAWVLATSWRLSACLAVGIITFAGTLGLQLIVAAAIPLAIAIAVTLRSVGLALYALMPSGLDQRGPLAMLRVLLTYLCALPPIAATVVSALVIHSFPFAITAGIIVAIFEALGLITFAAFRVSGRGAAFAQAEAA